MYVLYRGLPASRVVRGNAGGVHRHGCCQTAAVAESGSNMLTNVANAMHTPPVHNCFRQTPCQNLTEAQSQEQARLSTRETGDQGCVSEISTSHPFTDFRPAHPHTATRAQRKTVLTPSLHQPPMPPMYDVFCKQMTTSTCFWRKPTTPQQHTVSRFI